MATVTIEGARLFEHSHYGSQNWNKHSGPPQLENFDEHATTTFDDALTSINAGNTKWRTPNRKFLYLDRILQRTRLQRLYQYF